MRKTFVKTNSDTSRRRTKRGEIHYAEGHWYYLCVICGLNAKSNDEFLSHLKSQHCDEFKLDDPLHVTTVDNNKDYNLELNLGSKFEDSDVEIIESNAGSEDSDVENEDGKTSHFNVPNYIEETKSSENRELNNINASDGIDSEIEDLFDNEQQNELEIDWDTPFKPQQSHRPYKPRNSDYCCTYCGRTFRRRYQFDTHLNIHTGAKPYQCEICGRQFRASNTLQRHLITHNERSYICRYCNKSFSHRVALMSHERRHTQERKEQCDLCEKRFYTVNHLDTHKRRIHKMGNDLLPFACDLCPNRYRNSSMLNVHKNRKHYKTAKFQCEKCDKKFIDLQRLEEHRNTIHFDVQIFNEYVYETQNSLNI